MEVRRGAYIKWNLPVLILPVSEGRNPDICTVNNRGSFILKKNQNKPTVFNKQTD